MLQKRSSDFSDEQLRSLCNDPVEWVRLRNTNIILWEELERRCLRLGFVLQLRHGQQEPKSRGLSWNGDPEFRGF